MYGILINDFVNKKQTLVDSVVYYSRAIDVVEQMACEYVAEKEGEKYFKSKPYKKSKFDIKKGYAMVRKDTSFSTKITIFNKDPNGYFLSGELKKVIQFSTVRRGDFVPNTFKLDYDFCMTEDECDSLQKKRKILNEMLKKTLKPKEDESDKSGETPQPLKN